MATPLLELGALFAAVALVGAAANAIRQSVIPFYILAGLLLGPYVAGTLTETHLGRELAVGASSEAAHFVELGGELGVVFLLFFLGMEFNLERLVANRSRITRAGTVDLGFNFGVGLLLGYLLFGAILPAFVVAGMVYISSSAIITKSLIDLGWIANAESEPMLGTLVFEDLFIAVYLAVLSALVAGTTDLSDAATDVAIALAFILILLAFTHWGTAALDAVLSVDSSEFVILRVTGITVLVAGIALAVGVSEAVAAFFVGMAVSSTGTVHEVERLLEPVRDVFAAVFFFWIGMVTDPTLFAGVLGLVAAAVVATTPTKLLSGFWAGHIYELGDRRAVRVGLGMVTRGEFTLIIAAIVFGAASAGGPIPLETARQLNAFAVGYVLVMSLLGTTLMQYSGLVETRVADWRARHSTGTD